jgi:hypothetical protein
MIDTVRPNFFIIGAAKAATTSLSSLINAHPEGAIVEGKEPHFFSYNYLELGWEGYSKLFEHCRDKRAVGDASTSYSRIRYYPFTVARMRRDLPNAKIIYMVRNPLERMESAYVERLCSDARLEFSSVNDIVRSLPMVIDSSRYWEVFCAYRMAFGDANIKIVWFEEYVAHQTAVFQEVCRFLEINDTVAPDFGSEQVNDRSKAAWLTNKLADNKMPLNTKWDMDTRKLVIDLIRDDNCQFLSHFGKPRDYWGDLF